MAGGTQGSGRTSFQVPEEMRRMAEQSVSQTRQALENYLRAARRTSESMEQTSDKVQASTKDAAQKTLSAVEQNLRASLDYAERLVRAKDLQEITQCPDVRRPWRRRRLAGPGGGCLDRA